MFFQIYSKESYYPINKGGSKNSCGSYRPISILPLFSKTIEKLTHKRIMNFLEEFSILFKHRYDFQKGKSTERALVDIHSNIMKSVERKEKRFTQ